MDFLFFLNSVMLGVGLAMDAFSVSVANGLNDITMKRSKELLIASTFALFQIAMPLIGWVCVHSFVTYFQQFERFIPYIAFILLLFIGGGMIKGKKEEDEEYSGKLTFGALFLQGVATSIDALSVGFTTAEYKAYEAVVSSVIIGIVTFIICISGIKIGKVFGTRFSDKAEKIGGAILILIGLEILIKGLI